METRGANAVIQFFGEPNVLDGTQSGNPVNIEGNVLTSGQSVLWLMGTINNTGVITAATHDGATSWIVIKGDVTLEGGGHLTLTTDSSNPFFVSAIFGVFGGVHLALSLMRLKALSMPTTPALR